MVERVPVVQTQDNDVFCRPLAWGLTGTPRPVQPTTSGSGTAAHPPAHQPLLPTSVNSEHHSRRRRSPPPKWRWSIVESQAQILAQTLPGTGRGRARWLAEAGAGSVWLARFRAAQAVRSMMINSLLIAWHPGLLFENIMSSGQYWHIKWSLWPFYL